MWLTDIAHHHLAIAIVFIFAGHMYRTNWGIGHSMKEILDAHVPPRGRLGAGHRGLFETITNSLHMQLGLALASLGVATSLVAQHMYALPSYAFMAKDYVTQAALYTHHQYIAGFLMVGAFAHGAIFFVRDYDPETNKDNVLARMLEQKEAIISHLSWVSLFLGFHTLGLYVHNDTVVAFGQPEKQILIEPVFAQFIQAASGKALYGFDVLLSSANSPATVAGTKVWLPGWAEAINNNGNSLFLTIGPGDFLVHHAIALGLHTTTLILVKGALDARGSKLMPDKKDFGYSFPCDGPGRGGTCQSSSWDHVFLGLFWMYNSISVTIFHFSWKMQSDVWCTVSPTGEVTHITGGNFAASAVTINGWLRDFLWSEASQVIQSYGSAVSAYGLIFLGAHFIWAFSLMFLFSGRGYWQELIESIVWAHNKVKLGPAIQPRALSITQGRAVGLAHYLLGGIGTTWSFFLARIVSVG